MRVGELCALKWDDVQADAIHIHAQQLMYKENGRNYYYVDWTKDEKGFSQGGRRFPITIEIRNLLSEIKSVQDSLGIKSEYVFCNREGRWIYTKAYSDCLRALCRSWDFRWLTIMHFVCRWTAMYLFRLVFRLLKEHDYWDTQLRRMKNIIAMLERTRCKIYVYFWMDKQYRSHLGLTPNSINSNIKKPWDRYSQGFRVNVSMQEMGLEPTHCCQRQILSLMRLPFRHSLRLINFLNKIAQARNILSYSKTDCKKFFDSCKNYFIHYFIRILEMKNVLWKIMIFRLFCWRSYHIW